MNNDITSMPVENINLENVRFIQKVYAWMTIGLAVTAVTSFWVASTPSLINAIVGNRLTFYALLFIQLLIVVYLSSLVQKISAQSAQVLFIIYSFLEGLTFSIIFIVFDFKSIGATFLVTAGMFAVISFYGYVTKKDLTTIGNICFMGLVGVILASLVNMFVYNDNAFLIISWITVVVFVGLTAYDTQKIKQFNIIGNEGSDQDKKEAIIGALTLYLDFINLFIRLLSISGKRR